MPDVFLKRESDSELRFEHRPLGGWIFAGLGCAIAYFGGRYLDATATRWMAIVMGGLFAAIGFGGALWRYELTLDLLARTYRRCRGFWPTPRVLQGSLSELHGLVLTRTWRRGDDNASPVWVVSLDFQGWDKPVSVFETTSERKGYRRLEELARRLRISAIDRTGERESLRRVDELDRTVTDREPDRGSESSHALEDPPAGSGIERTSTEIGAPTIVLPAAGFNWGAVFLALFGVPFAGLGLLALASALGWKGIEVEGTQTAKWIVGGLFVVVGLLCWTGALFGSLAREFIRRENDALVITLRAFGRHYRRRRLPLDAIEEIAIKPGRSPTPGKTEVVMRTDALVARIAGDLPTDSQQWLRRALLVLARR